MGPGLGNRGKPVNNGIGTSEGSFMVLMNRIWEPAALLQLLIIIDYDCGINNFSTNLFSFSPESKVVSSV